MVQVAGFDGLVEIGRGGFGVVYRAQQSALSRQVAIKVMAATDLTERDRGRFAREVAAMGALSGHPHVVEIHQAGFTADGRPYLVMPYLPAGSLGTLVRSGGPLPLQRVLDIGVKLAGALETAHRAGILHRDIKPDNVLLDRFDQPRLSDFGIASAVGVATATAAGSLTASIAFAPPEVLDGGRPGVAGDVYSLGASLHALLSGHAPFVRSTDTSMAQLLARTIAGEVGPLPAGIPPQVSEVLGTALALDAAARQQSALVLGAALQQLQVELRMQRSAVPVVGIAAPPIVVVTGLATPPATSAPVPQTDETVRGTPVRAAEAERTTARQVEAPTPTEPDPTVAGARRRSPVLLVVGGLLLTIAVGATAASILLLSQGDAAPDHAELAEAAVTSRDRIFERLDDPASLTSTLAEGTGAVPEASTAGAWWALADWCDAEGFDRLGRCYDHAADYLVDHGADDPRLVVLTDDLDRASVQRDLASGYETALLALDLADDGPSTELRAAGRPGAGILCDPDCAAVGAELLAAAGGVDGPADAIEGAAPSEDPADDVEDGQAEDEATEDPEPGPELTEEPRLSPAPPPPPPSATAPVPGFPAPALGTWTVVTGNVPHGTSTVVLDALYQATVRAAADLAIPATRVGVIDTDTVVFSEPPTSGAGYYAVIVTGFGDRTSAGDTSDSFTALGLQSYPRGVLDAL